MVSIVLPRKPSLVSDDRSLGPRIVINSLKSTCPSPDTILKKKRGLFVRHFTWILSILIKSNPFIVYPYPSDNLVMLLLGSAGELLSCFWVWIWVLDQLLYLSASSRLHQHNFQHSGNDSHSFNTILLVSLHLFGVRGNLRHSEWQMMFLSWTSKVNVPLSRTLIGYIVTMHHCMRVKMLRENED